MKVLKFGGSSVGTADAIAKVIAIVTESIKKEPTIVVVSASIGLHFSFPHRKSCTMLEVDNAYARGDALVIFFFAHSVVFRWVSARIRCFGSF
mgnify:CR=1 FL=1